MVKLPQLNRHIVGLSAIALTLAAMGYAANVMSTNSRSSVALQESVQPRATAELDSNFLSMLTRIPKNAFGRAGESERAANPGESAVAPKSGEASDPAASARNWSPQDWRVAAEAVEKLRSTRAGLQSRSMSGLVWAPPEEIAHKSGSR